MNSQTFRHLIHTPRNTPEVENMSHHEDEEPQAANLKVAGMPKPLSREAPKLRSGQDPREFFKHLDDLFEEFSVTEDASKKYYVCSYSDEKMVFKIRATKGYKNGTYDQWKRNILRYYPGATDEDRSSMTYLREVLKPFKDLDASSYKEWLTLTFEATPVIQAILKAHKGLNSDIANMIFDCSEESFAHAVKTRVRMTGYYKEHENFQDSDEENAAYSSDDDIFEQDDPYRWKDILKEALRLSKSNKSSRAGGIPSSNSKPASVNNTSVTQSQLGIKTELANVITELHITANAMKDSAKAQTESSRLMAKEQTESFKEIVKIFQQSMQMPTNTVQHQHQQSATSTNQSNNHSHSNWNRSVKPSDSDMCYFCEKPGHVILNCPDCLEMIERKLLRRQDNRIVMRDGGPLPRFPKELTYKERIEAFFEKEEQEQLRLRAQNMFSTGSQFNPHPAYTPPQTQFQQNYWQPPAPDPREVTVIHGGTRQFLQANDTLEAENRELRRQLMMRDIGDYGTSYKFYGQLPVGNNGPANSQYLYHPPASQKSKSSKRQAYVQEDENEESDDEQESRTHRGFEKVQG
ncbi:hypothetical protein VKT23_013797 [Stygiomarasmius scandens]|uniref:CCHC-type domain-containing protein n=1 Tax=Marasmiellus scandens TaxID=2682957 RepID=A0ABR1J3T8_9AGAR